MNKTIFSFFVFFTICQLSAQDYYSALRNKYWIYEENDQKAFHYLNIYISKAKKEKNYAELFQAYDDAIRYSPNKKIEYADSAISAAKLSGNSDLIGSSYISKGAVYYFTYRKFQPALNEYLKAYEYTKNTDDEFLKYQNLYHIGVVKSYLGYYEEALQLFKSCNVYFKSKIKANIHPNLIKNHQKGYLNCLHQMIVCYQQLGNYTESEKLIKEGLDALPKDSFFNLEKSYFYKSEAITEFNKKSYQNSIQIFNNALPEFIKINDYTFASVIYYYRGSAYDELKNTEKALSDYKKVDSIFNKYQFILPELRNNYEKLITFYRNKNQPKEELYYTKQLLKADSIISTDFKYLSNRIHRDYDTKSLLEAQSNLEKTNSFGKFLLIFSFVVILVLILFLAYWLRKKKEIQIKYEELLEKISSKNTKIKENADLNKLTEKNSKIEIKTVQLLKSKFSDFEKNNGFLEKGITAGKLAIEFGTNATYISQFMNEYQGCNFNTYINKLRIDYATEKIYNNKLWQKYSVEDIALACGFSNRQSFSNLFYEQNGIRPADFLKKRKEEIRLKRVS
ncbi:helix-turn-helix domain-containing protein [Chryseobacterium sp. SL1]|uniref:helix-turn-helix domain-containing protein n=1 Tax=Chryseobacterium sp. SL1 TaxID=2995159 RepID=UPI002275D8FA|nr:helix-turn-helix domain-containing protein [Chryseobacterium sp. SL1]MCY1663164.1 helix-turn-helix domain-containing protein [Chryseobacterium sp. SL1]